MNNTSILVRIIVFVLFGFVSFLVLNFLDPASLQSPIRTAIALALGLVFAVFGIQILKVIDVFDWISFLSKPFR